MSEYISLNTIPGVRIELKYASTDNFMNEDLYHGDTSCRLHAVAATKLAKAAELLRASNPGFCLLVYDALRPRSVQRRMWARVVGTAQEAYVTDPELGSMHNYGLAVDLTVVDAAGKSLDMGAGYDDFRAISEPRLESQFLNSGGLSQAQLENRLILRRAMTGAGFLVLPNEWWHFDAVEPSEARARFSIVE